MKKQVIATFVVTSITILCSAAAFLTDASRPASVAFEELSLHFEVDLPSQGHVGTLLEFPAEVVLTGAAEHGIARVRLRDVAGQALIGLDCPSPTTLGVSELELETAGRTLRQLLGAYPPGEYRVEALTITGVHVEGIATLRDVFPGPFAVVSPFPDELVDAAGAVTLAWTPSLDAARYLLEVEQEELRFEFTVTLTADQTTFTLPAGLLQPGRAYEYSLAVEGDTDNQLELEGRFFTLPEVRAAPHSIGR